MSHTQLFAAAAAAVCLIAAPASAALVTVTYEGVVADGVDGSGVFGAAGTDLTGAAFAARFVLDLDAGSILLNPPLSSSYDFFSPVDFSLLAGASLTINGSRFDFACRPADYCEVGHSNSAGGGGVWGVASSIGLFAVDTTVPETWNQNMDVGISSTTHPFVTEWDFRKNLSYVFQPGDAVTGGFEIRTEVFPDNAPPYFRDFAQGHFTAQSVSVAVPEPATWALMILGFGAVGVSLRRRAFSATAA